MGRETAHRGPREQAAGGTSEISGDSATPGSVRAATKRIVRERRCEAASQRGLKRNAGGLMLVVLEAIFCVGIVMGENDGS